jgi:hypothetical protein
MSLCTYGLLACSAFPAQPCELKLLHAAIKGGKVTKAGEPWWARVSVSCNGLSGHLNAAHAMRHSLFMVFMVWYGMHLARPALNTLRCPALLQASRSGAPSRHMWIRCCAASLLWESTCCGTCAGRACPCCSSSAAKTRA